MLLPLGLLVSASEIGEDGSSYYSIDDYLTHFGVDTDTGIYLGARYSVDASSDTTTKIYNYTIFCFLDSTDSIESVTNDNGICTISFTSSIYVYYSAIRNTFDSSSNSWTPFTSSYLSNSNRYTQINKIIYDYNNHTMELWQEDDTEVYKTFTNIVEMVSTFPNVYSDTDDMSISVEFTPELVGEVDRMRYIESENDYDEMDYFKFKVTNNSKFPVQFQLFIVPKGSEDYDGISGFSNAAFVFMEKEWVYSLDLTNYVNYTNGTTRKQYKYTDWQYLASGETCVRRVNFSQTSIVKNREYTVRVRAVPCEFDCASEAGSSSSGYSDSFLEDKGFSSVDEYFSYQKYYDHLKKEIVYTSDFYMASNYDITYDSNDYSNGIAPVGSEYMYESLDKSLSAFLDNQGEQVIEDIGYNSENAPVQFDDSDFDYVAAQNAFSNNANSNNFNFTQQTSGYFSMLQMVLSWFPSWYWGLVSFGLLSVVIIGIIKVIGG